MGGGGRESVGDSCLQGLKPKWWDVGGGGGNMISDDFNYNKLLINQSSLNLNPTNALIAQWVLLPHLPQVPLRISSFR